MIFCIDATKLEFAGYCPKCNRILKAGFTELRCVWDSNQWRVKLIGVCSNQDIFNTFSICGNTVEFNPPEKPRPSSELEKRIAKLETDLERFLDYQAEQNERQS
jgi:hypothetical protein